MIHNSRINIITERKDLHGDPVPFTFKTITKGGQIIEGSICIVTSSNFSNKTRNIKFLDSGEIRTIRNLSIIELNGVEVTL